MMAHILSSFSFFFTIVWAGGYQGSLERIFMYQAYLIDGLNPAAIQTMGWRCIGNNWNRAARTCTGIWTPMPGHAANQRLTYDQFIAAMGRAPAHKRWSVLASDGTLDIERTAMNTYTLFTTQPGQAIPRVRNFGANEFMRDTGEWNEAIKKAGLLVEQAYKNNAGTLTDHQKKLFQGFDKARELIVQARIGDHGFKLIPKARIRLNPQGINVVTKSVGKESYLDFDSRTEVDIITPLGTNPVPGGDLSDTVDWQETIKQAENAGIADARTRVMDCAKDIYRQNSNGFDSAREHKQVVDSYRRVGDAKVGCGRP